MYGILILCAETHVKKGMYSLVSHDYTPHEGTETRLASHLTDLTLVSVARGVTIRRRQPTRLQLAALFLGQPPSLLHPTLMTAHHHWPRDVLPSTDTDQPRDTQLDRRGRSSATCFTILLLTALGSEPHIVKRQPVICVCHSCTTCEAILDHSKLDIRAPSHCA